MISSSRASTVSRVHDGEPGVLCHLETAGGDTAGVGRLAGTEEDPLLENWCTASGSLGMLAPSATT